MIGIWIAAMMRFELADEIVQSEVFKLAVVGLAQNIFGQRSGMIVPVKTFVEANEFSGEFDDLA